ncbi:HPt (histidine-containing phosphotransfer) domain-containing protein [Algoriphagus sp. 4150]|uniref:Hpt domain-containing protein n=1 Tax=Algoriphagus sp. 4150 TaxID=2817756 RepID=UPI002860344E|nr:Hpt domain-containing protein [Algoriphagus sp. 4150]MDR7128208.1 HPt (histidine-containing phosphotransfer) domain-containing protein [Algoriphagus sp. 4150]
MYKFISTQSIYQYFGEDKPEMIREMIQIILDTNIKDLKELDTYYKLDQYATVNNRCHKAKPTMVYIGAQKTRKILEEIETNPGDFPELNESLQAHLIEIETELNQFLATLN